LYNRIQKIYIELYHYYYVVIYFGSSHK